MADWIVQALVLLFGIAIQSHVRSMANGQNGAHGESAVHHVALVSKLEQEHVLILYLSMADWIVQTLIVKMKFENVLHTYAQVSQSMANGRIGAHGESVVHHVALVSKLEQEHVLILNLSMAD